LQIEKDKKVNKELRAERRKDNIREQYLDRAEELKNEKNPPK